MVANRAATQRRARWWSVPIAILAVLASVSAAAAPALATSAGASGGGPPATTLSSAPSFAARAGYSSAWPAEVSQAAPLAGAVEVDLTFEPTNASLFDPAASDAAPMTVSEVADAYGLSPSAYAAIEQYFESRGVSVLHAWPDRLSLSLSGPASAVGAAFGTSLDAGEYDGHAVSFPVTPPTLPTPFEAEVAAVVGLSSGFDTFNLPALPAESVRATNETPAQLSGTLITPAVARDIYDISGLYNLTASPTYATGHGIVLLLWGYGYDPSDLATFYAQYYPASYPRPSIVAYPVDGAPQPGAGAVNDPSNGSREMTLDLEWSGSMAPGATLDAVYAPPGPASDGYSPTEATMVDALNTAINPNDVPGVAAISMSFGSVEQSGSPLQSQFETDFAVATREGISLFAATGDTGGDLDSDCTGGPAPEYPSSSTYVVAVGGTAVSVTTNPLGGVTGFSETAWSDGGGGYSTEYTAPSWQLVGSAAAPIKAAGGYRGMPDVSASAQDNFLYFGGQTLEGDGTSFASPLWAGMVTEMDALNIGSGRSVFGMITPRLYELAANASGANVPFHDVTSGSNCVASAEPGWDAATGWGSPSAVDLYEHFVATFVNLTVSAGPSPVAPGGTVTVTGSVTNATTGAPIADLAVLVTLASTGLGGPCAGTFGSSAPETNGSGAVSVTFSIPGCYLGSGAIATVKVTGDGYFALAQSSIAVNLLGFAPSLAPLAEYPANVVFFVVLMAIAIAIGGVLGRRPPETLGLGGPPPAPAAATGPPPAPDAGPSPPPGAMSSGGEPPTAPPEGTSPPVPPT